VEISLAEVILETVSSKLKNILAAVNIYQRQ